jgi:hypothetical protein
MNTRVSFSYALCLATLLCPRASSAQTAELIERTLAIVGGHVITLSDARAATALGLIDIGKPADPVDAAATALVERELVLREVQRYAPPEPSPSAIAARVETLRQRFPNAGAFTSTLEGFGFNEVRIVSWIRDDLRIQAYLAQRFAAAGAPTEQEVSQAYMSRRAEFEQAGTTFEQATPMLREQLSAARRRELIADWVADLRRRTDVVLIPK